MAKDHYCKLYTFLKMIFQSRSETTYPTLPYQGVTNYTFFRESNRRGSYQVQFFALITKITTKKFSKIFVWGELAPQNSIFRVHRSLFPLFFNPSEMTFSIMLRNRRYAIPTVIVPLITKIITKKMCKISQGVNWPLKNGFFRVHGSFFPLIFNPKKRAFSIAL